MSAHGQTSAPWWHGFLARGWMGSATQPCWILEWMVQQMGQRCGPWRDLALQVCPVDRNLMHQTHLPLTRPLNLCPRAPPTSMWRMVPRRHKALKRVKRQPQRPPPLGPVRLSLPLSVLPLLPLFCRSYPLNYSHLSCPSNPLTPSVPPPATAPNANCNARPTHMGRDDRWTPNLNLLRSPSTLLPWGSLRGLHLQWEGGGSAVVHIFPSCSQKSLSLAQHDFVPFHL